MKKGLIIASVACLSACCGKKETAQATTGSGSGSAAATPYTLVYRTRADHQNHVPVLLSADRSRIISYPHPKDLRTGGGYPVPTPLGKGYLLDNRGIGMDVAYLSMTYEEYAAMEQAPSLEKLDALIIDRDPLEELCECPRRSEFKDVTKELAAWVENDELMKHCKKLK